VNLLFDVGIYLIFIYAERKASHFTKLKWGI